MKIDSATNIVKYEEEIVFKLRSLYTAYGYRPYKMSKFEEYDLYVRNRDFLVSESVITFNDTDGRLLALKPDVTLSIVKNSTDVNGFVNKVYYNENVYRVSSRTETYREIMQTGLECIGDIDTYNVIEVLSLAAKSLEAISPDYVLDVSHMGIVFGLLEMTGADDITKSKIIECISSKNAHDLAKICNENNVDANVTEKLCKFISIYGNINSVIEKLKALDLGEWANVAIDELQYISDALDNDLNTSLAVTALYDVLKMDTNDDTKLALIKDFEKVLGLGLLEAVDNINNNKENAENSEADSEFVSYIKERIKARAEAKAAKQYALADDIRAELLEKGVTLIDTKEGTKFTIA